MNITPSTRPLESIRNTNMLLSAIACDEDWRTAARTELDQLTKFIAEGRGKLAVTGDPRVELHIRALLVELENARKRLDNALVPQLDHLDDWTNPQVLQPQPVARLARVAPETRVVSKDTTRSRPTTMQLAGIGIVVVVVLVVASSLLRRGQVNRPITSSDTSSPAQQSATRPQQAPVASNAGVRLLASDVYDPCGTTIIYTPIPGRRAVGVEVVVFNDVSVKDVSVNPLYFTLIGSDDLPYETHLASCDRQIDLPDLGRGESVRGVIGFDLPTSVSPKAIRFKGFGMDTFVETALPAAASESASAPSSQQAVGTFTPDETQKIRLVAQTEYSPTLKEIQVNGRTVVVVLEKARPTDVEFREFLLYLVSAIPKFFVQVDIQELRIVYNCEIKDEYGNLKITPAITVSFSNELYKKIDWKNISGEQFEALLKFDGGASVEINQAIKPIVANLGY